MQIRATNVEDAAELSVMMISSWRVSYVKVLASAKLDEICSLWLTPEKFLQRAQVPDAVNFVAVIDDVIVGHLFAEFSSETNLHIAYLYVAAEFQKQGIGISLLANAEGVSSNLQTITLGVFGENLLAIDFYVSQGFEIIGEDNPLDWKPGDPTGLKMVKLVSPD